MCSCQTAGGQLQNLPAPQQSLILPGAGSNLAEQVPQLVHLRSLGLVLILTASGTLRAGAALCLCSSTQQLPADRSTFVLLLSARVIDELKPDIKQAETLRAWQAGSGMAAAAPALMTALHAWHRPQESSGTGLLAERQMLSMSGVLTWHLMHAFRCMLDCGNRVFTGVASTGAWRHSMLLPGTGMAGMHDCTHLTAGNKTSSSEAAWKVHTARRNLWRSTRPRSCEALVSRLCWSLDACSEASCGGVGDTFNKGQQL